MEIPYINGANSARPCTGSRKVGITPENRGKMLRHLLDLKPIIRVLEAHNGITGMIIENTKVQKNGNTREFDGIWISSLTDSIAKGKPDNEFIDLTSRLNTIHQILEITSKPVIVDSDSGGFIEHFPYYVRTYERLGISAIIIEDKIGFKRNSLLETDIKQTQDSIENFSKKISAGKKAQINENFMIIARIESLVLNKGLDDALERAGAYIEAGADAIMIHSKAKTADEVLNFCREYAKFEHKVPLVAVPTTYYNIMEMDLAKAGIRIVIYANHLLRSAYPAMLKTAKSILMNERSSEAEQYCMPVNDLLSLIPE